MIITPSKEKIQYHKLIFVLNKIKRI